MNCEFCKKFFKKKSGKRFCSISCGLSNRAKPDSSVLCGNDSRSAYWLGLMYSDGCLSKQANGKYRLTFSSNDLDIMEQIHKEATPGKKLYKNRDSYMVVSHNKEDIDYVISLGMTERKSLTLSFPNLPQHLIPAFIRGYFDGDGCVYFSTTTGNKTPYTYTRIRFTCGSQSFLQSLGSILDEVGIKWTIQEDIRNSNSSCYLNINAQECVAKFQNWIYQDDGPFLSRKKDKFFNYDIV